MESADFILDPAALTPPLSIPALFGRDAPLEIDIGCGKGRFLVARARQFPDIAFLGIERRQQRVEKVSRKLAREELTNARVLKLEAAYVVEELVPAQSVSAFYLFFPDPWPKRRHHRRRLFSPPFMDSVYRTLRPEGRINVATDHADYFKQIHGLLEADPRFREGPAFVPSEEETTEFEITFRALHRPIHRCAFGKT